MWRKVDNLWITIFKRPYHIKKKPCFQGFFGGLIFAQIAVYPQAAFQTLNVYPQYPVVTVHAHTQCIRISGAIPSFFAYSCVKIRSNFPVANLRGICQTAQMKKEAPCASLDLLKSRNTTANDIGRGGVYGATASIFREGNLISRKKNRFLADFTTGIRRIQVKSVRGWLWRGKGSPVHQTDQIFFSSIHFSQTSGQ